LRDYSELLGELRKSILTPEKTIKQPASDLELAKVLAWLKKNNLRAHVLLSGTVYVEDKATGEVIKL
jgi:hypothetical protein